MEQSRAVVDPTARGRFTDGCPAGMPGRSRGRRSTSSPSSPVGRIVRSSTDGRSTSCADGPRGRRHRDHGRRGGGAGPARDGRGSRGSRAVRPGGDRGRPGAGGHGSLTRGQPRQPGTRTAPSDPRTGGRPGRDAAPGPPVSAAGHGRPPPALEPHGHVAAVLGMLRSLGLERTPRPAAVADARTSPSRSSWPASWRPASKLATARGLGATTLAAELDVEGATEDELYGALDWLLARQPSVERALARRHLAPGALVLLRRHVHLVRGHAAARSRPTATAGTTGPTGPRWCSAC